MRKICTQFVDLNLTIAESGQRFLYAQKDGSFGVIIDREPVRLFADASGVYAEGGTDSAIRDFLDLDRDYTILYNNLDAFPLVRQCVTLLPGLRVMNQDPWDALVQFILSANNNISRIRKLTLALSDPGDIPSLPSPEALARETEAHLRALGTGYRAPYLIKTAQSVADGFPLYALKDMPYADAHRLLTTLSGVGDKVADCVLLFGCRHAEAFPVDVWVERVVDKIFNLHGSRKKLAGQARELLGENAGLIQQFLFHAMRTGLINEMRD